MITPSFSLTATERVLPNLALDFTTASLDARVTFTRTTDATHPASYVASTGYITAATDNQARFDYDPIALTCKGLLIEESRANLLLYSQDFSQAYYNKIRGVIDTVNFISSPANDNTGRIFTCNTTTGSGFYFSRTTITIPSASPTSVTLFLKKGTSNWGQITLSDNGTNGVSQWFNLATGAVASSSVAGTGWAKTSASMTLYANGWYRCQLSVSTTGTNVRFDCYPCVSSDGGYGCTSGDVAYLWGNQIEAGAFPTSYVVTNGASLTRNADVATMTGANFTSWYNATQGTFVIRSATKGLGVGANSCSVAIADGGANNYINVAQYLATNSRRGIVVAGGVAQAALLQTVAIDGAFRKYAFAYKQDSFAGAMDGSSVSTDVSGTIPTVNRLSFGNLQALGAATDGNLNGYISYFAYYPQRLIDNEVTAFSK